VIRSLLSTKDNKEICKLRFLDDFLKCEEIEQDKGPKE